MKALTPTRSYLLLPPTPQKKQFHAPSPSHSLLSVSLRTPQFVAMPTSRIKLIPLLLLVILQTHLKISNGLADLGLKTLKSGEIDAMAGRICQGKFGNCRASMAEFEEVDSEAPKRRSVLAGERRYISYETLRRDLVPCSTPGSSYYHCGAAPANHYTRGCSRITQCARF